jgi:hypothetical protein
MLSEILEKVRRHCNLVYKGKPSGARRWRGFEPGVGWILFIPFLLG